MGRDKVVEDGFDSNRGHRLVEDSEDSEDRKITQLIFYPLRI